LSTETVARPTSGRFHQAAALALIIALVAAASITMNRSAAQFTDATDPVTVDATAGGVDIILDDGNGGTTINYTVDNVGPGWTDTFDATITNDSTVALPTDLTDIGITGADTAEGATADLMGHLQVEVVRDGTTAYTGTWDTFVNDHETFGATAGADVWRSTNVLATNSEGTAETSTYTFNLSYPEGADNLGADSSAGFSFAFEGLQIIEE